MLHVYNHLTNFRDLLTSSRCDTLLAEMKNKHADMHYPISSHANTIIPTQQDFTYNVYMMLSFFFNGILPRVLTLFQIQQQASHRV